MPENGHESPNGAPQGLSPIDDSVPAPPRTFGEIALEAALLIPNVLKLFGRILSDERVSVRRKVLLAAVMAYVVSPVDLIPDFLLGIGHLDDIVLLSVALDHLMRGIDEEIVLEYWDGSIDSLDLVRSVFAWGAEVVPSSFRRMLPR